jgi:hypothetical protein
MKDDGDDN